MSWDNYNKKIGKMSPKARARGDVSIRRWCVQSEITLTVLRRFNNEAEARAWAEMQGSCFVAYEREE